MPNFATGGVADGAAAPEPGRGQLELEYDRIWRDFGPSLARLASSYESSAHACEDLLQEIRLAIWIALPKFRGESSLRTFLYRIAHNRALTHVWRSKRNVASEEPDDLPDPGSTPEASAIRNTNRLRLLDAIRQLPIPFRQVLTLALEDLSNAEIAAVLGLSENNVAVRMNRARNLLKEKFAASERLAKR